MPWSTALSVGGSLLSGGLGSSSAKKSASDIKKAVREANDRQMIAGNEIKYDVQPFLNTGQDANARLAELLGIASPKGYAPKPTRDQVANEFSTAHYQKYGRNYSAKDSDMGWQNNQIDKVYAERLADWEKGLEEYQAANPDDGTGGSDFGYLLKNFTNEDFVKDPGYEFRLGEGEKGINRALSARGGFDSGSALKALARYNQDYGSNEFTNAFNRDSLNKGRMFDFLSGTTNRGLDAAGTKASVLTGSANQQSANLMNGARQVGDLNMQGAAALNSGIQGAIGNYVYGTQRNAGVTSNNPYIINNATPTNASTPTPWYLT